MPDNVHGPALPEHDAPGYRVFEGCDGGFFIEHSGEPLAVDADTLREVREATGSLLLGGAGVFGSGIGACCDEEGVGNLCIVLSANAATFELEAALAWSAETFADEPRCFGLKFELEGNTQPRCEPDYPDCGPVPVCQDHPAEAVCCQAPPYDPGATRTPVATDPVTDQPCGHDGDCVIGGAGGRCENWQQPPLPEVGSCDPALAESFCGCVQGQCQWYEQG